MDILIVEDEKSIREVLQSYFLKEGWQVYIASDGLEALHKIERFKLDVVLLDLMIPKMSGEDVCKRIRETSKVPIMIISSKSREEDMINGLNIGADDYIVKPFRIKEVLARINALLRRMDMFKKQDDPILRLNQNGLVINFETQEVLVNQKAVKLTSTEFKILDALVKKPRKIFSRQDLSYIVQGYRYIGDGRTMDAHIKNLRKKIEHDPKKPEYIVTKIGAGYTFNSFLDREV
ncbi:response regulator transcription factor [Lederbergia galactosidilytica]|uniref:Chemotaxis protein CheY n=1 Tax=Lederbergia galactosidilytica TaxID=217031 RepID=A0A0Q9XTQ0_9BACI|nr:response regulator transcription factor [Lederbergia galactosidilytica]KRG12011.1 chemotaxis protein CheY [Lederbergia galactosidilytica]KRG12945.1 chemotaxis protein CheY [Virgibacillus soli]MBP1916172.1 DNA-binding response OmpR family regulator [Lederbergia galactosidilytica]OAK70191.1 chemotaxis protein CheY [Lederbergia galactosidilytica]